MTRIHVLAGGCAGMTILFAPPEPRPEQGGGYQVTSDGYRWVWR